MVITHDMNQSVDDKGEKTVVDNNLCHPGLFIGPFNGDDDVSEHLAGHAIQVRKGDDIGGAVSSEELVVHLLDLAIIDKEDAQVSIVKPQKG